MNGMGGMLDGEVWIVEVDADTSAFEARMKAATGAGRQFSNALATAFDGIAVKGRAVGDVLRALALNLSGIVQKAAMRPLAQGFESMLSGLLGGRLGFANGAAFQHVLPVPFAKGGIIQNPMSFPVGGGRMGLAGERGAEAIMPLARGPDGRLGVVAEARGGQGINVVFNVTATDAESFRRSETQVAAMLSRALALGQRNL